MLFFREKQTLRVMTSMPRSGTHWLKFMICHVMKKDPLEKRLQDPNELRRALAEEAPHRLCYDHFHYDFHGSILNPRAFPGLRMILLYRHPLDAYFSEMNWMAWKNCLPFPGLDVAENIKRHLAKWETQRPRSVRYRHLIRQQVIEWKKFKWVLSVRYEDLIENTYEQLCRVLEHLRIPHESRAVKEAIEANRFEKLSGGRSPGMEDRHSHYRKGMPGEWQEAFDDRSVELMERQIGDCIGKMGYTLKKDRPFTV